LLIRLPHSFSPCLTSLLLFFFPTLRPPPRSPLFPYTTLFRSKNTVSMASNISLPCCIQVTSMIVPVNGRYITTSQSSPQSRSRRSEEHTSELQSRENLVCRLLLEKKNDLRQRQDTTQTHAPRV